MHLQASCPAWSSQVSRVSPSIWHPPAPPRAGGALRSRHSISYTLLNSLQATKMSHLRVLIWTRLPAGLRGVRQAVCCVKKQFCSYFQGAVGQHISVSQCLDERHCCPCGGADQALESHLPPAQIRLSYAQVIKLLSVAKQAAPNLQVLFSSEVSCIGFQPH